MGGGSTPRTWWMTALADIEEWSAEGDAINRAPLTPLRRRPMVDEAPRVMVCHGLYGGYVPDVDSHPQGVHNADFYNFSHWQYVDVFAYMTRYWIAPPPPGWVNAGHRNGVPVLGSIRAWPGLEGGQQLLPLLSDPDAYARQLAAMARYFGFDGWSLEFAVDFSDHPDPTWCAERLATFVQSLADGVHADNPSGLVVWHDAVTRDGVPKPQGQLNDLNRPFFDASDTMVLNPLWTTEDPDLTASARAAGNRKLDLHAEIHVATHGFESPRLVETARKVGLSAALSGASWTYQQESDSQPFQSRERKFWHGGEGAKGSDALTATLGDGVAGVVAPRPVPVGLPFVTTFDVGRGRRFCIEGRRVSNVGGIPANIHWGNMSQQSLLPTWLDFLSSGRAGAFAMGLSLDDAWDGGGSLLVQSGPDAVPGDLAVFELFATALRLTTPALLSIAFAPVEDAPLPDLRVILHVAPEETDAAPPILVPVLEADALRRGDGDRWRVFTVDLTGHAGVEVTRIALEATVPLGSTRAAVLVGELKIVPLTRPGFTLGPVRALRCDTLTCHRPGMDAEIGAFDLVWEAPAGAGPGSISHYTVYLIQSDGSRRHVGRAFAEAYHVADTLFEDDGTLTVAVAPTDANGYHQPPEEAATLRIVWRES